MSNISLDSVSVGTLLELFKGEMKKLDNLVNKLDLETNEIKKTWQGNASDRTLEKIEKFKIVFEDIKRKNEKYINFVDYAVTKYKDLDTSKINFVDRNIGAFDTSFYGDIQG